MAKFELGGLYRYRPLDKVTLRFITIDRSDPFGKCIPGSFFKFNELVVIIHVGKDVWGMTSTDIGIMADTIRSHFKKVKI